MKLYQTDLSPFPTRVRLMLYAKGIDAEIIMPPGFHGDTTPKGEYEEVNPLGRVPTLVLDDGTTLIESEVICEYLEDAYPEPPMHPADPVSKARMRLLSRLSDIYLVMAMVPLFDVMELPPSEWPQKVISKALREIATALGYLEEFIGEEGYAVGDSLTPADGTLIPMLLLVADWLPIFRGPAPLLDAVPKTKRYWEEIAKDPIAARLIEETRKALLESMGRG